MKSGLKIKITFILLLVFSLGQGQASLFTSTLGSDTNIGSLESPWKTIQYSINRLTPGDTLNILEGIYPEKVYLEVSGSPSQMITIRAYRDHKVVLDANDISDQNPLFYAENQSNYRVQGIHFTNAYHSNGSGGFYIDGFGHNIELIDCIFSNIAISRDPNASVNTNTNQPVVSFAGSSANDSISHILVSGIEIYDCRPGYSECLSMGGNVTNFIIENNYIHNNTNIAIDLTGNYGVCSIFELDHARRGVVRKNICHDNIDAYSFASAGVYVDGGHDIIIEHNILHHNHYGVEIGCEESGTTENIICRNNILHNNQSAGIALGGYDDSTGGTVLNSEVSNNTFYHNDSGNNGNGEMLFTQFENGIILNNIFYLAGQNYLMSNDLNQPNLTMDYNLVYLIDGANAVEAYLDESDIEGLGNIYNKISAGGHDSFGDPEFEDTESADFHIQATSEAIDAGDPDFVTDPGAVDIDGEDRNIGIIDCGADEYYLNTSISDQQFTNDFLIYPNPTRNELFIIGDLTSTNIELYDMMGRLVKFNWRNEGHRGINISQLETGIYLLTLIQEGIKQTFRIVKK